MLYTVVVLVLQIILNHRYYDTFTNAPTCGYSADAQNIRWCWKTFKALKIHSLNLSNRQIWSFDSYEIIKDAVMLPVFIYRVAQKSKPLPNYQQIVLNRIKVSSEW